MSIEQQFDAAVKVIQSLPKDGFFQPSNEMRLRFYAFFKQATEGPNMTKKPAFYDIINRYKWDAWTKCGQMSKLEAMQLYVDELKKVIETVSMTHEVSEFLDLLGPFYEFLPNDITENGGTNGHANNEAKSTIDQKINDENMNENQIASTMMNHQETFTTYDSDGDEFADTIDLSPQHQQQQPQIFGINVNNNNQSSPLIIDQSLLSTTVSSIMNDNNNNNNQMIESSNLSFDMNEQLAVAIFQLQNSLNRINNRMDKLEQQVIRQQQQQQQQTSASAKKYGNNAWPMSELRPQTKIFILTWPFALFLMLNYFQRLRKK